MNNEIIEWQSKYEVGIEDIDFQHHFFLNLINRLAGELTKSDDLEYKSDLISELNAYARFHFISEENMMSRVGFPGYINHKNLHLELIDQLSSRANMFAIENSNAESVHIIDFLVDWFFFHTNTIDREFAAYLKVTIPNCR
jgi:hemerythrin